MTIRLSREMTRYEREALRLDESWYPSQNLLILDKVTEETVRDSQQSIIRALKRAESDGAAAEARSEQQMRKIEADDEAERQRLRRLAEAITFDDEDENG